MSKHVTRACRGKKVYQRGKTGGKGRKKVNAILKQMYILKGKNIQASSKGNETR